MPSARMHSEGTLSIHIANHKPYTRMGIIAYPFNWLEAIYQYTDISDRLYSDVFAFSRNQTFKDKGFDLKIRILEESRYIPQIAVGFRDLAGTSLFSAEYIAASKFVKNIDFTLGMGWGTYSNKKISNPLGYLHNRFKNPRTGYEGDKSKGGELTTGSFFKGDKVGIFGGLEYFSSRYKGLRLKAEYDSIDYELEGNKPQPLDSRINYGISYSFNENLSFSFGKVRGNTLQFSFNLKNNFAKKNKKLKQTDRPINIENSKVIKVATSTDDRILYLASLRYLKNEGINLRSANISENELEISYSENRFTSHAQSVGRIINVLDQISPEKITKFSLIKKNRDISLNKSSIHRDDYLIAKKNHDFELVGSFMKYEPSFNEALTHAFKPKIPYPSFFWELGADYSSHIGGADRFIAGSIDIKFKSELLLNKDLSFQVVSRYPVVSTFDVLTQFSDSVLPHVRTDIVSYMKESDNSISLTRAQLNYFKQINRSLFFKFSSGILESMFAGAGTEVLYRPMYSNFAVGLEAFHVKQRAYDQKLKFLDYRTNTGHITFYFKEPRSNVLLKLSGGRYLAEDSGFTFDISRKFSSGLYMGVYATLTDISKEEFGEGSFDKGFYFNMPIDTFIQSYSRKRTGYGLRPLTRDGGQRIIHGFDLYGITDDAEFSNIQISRDEFFN